jgi:histidinol-phosphate aminotransferase
MTAYQPDEALLRHHGDADVEPGLVDLAVNVRAGTPPAWLRDALATVDLAQYPNPAAARSAVAERHRRRADEVLITAGAAEAFVLIARAVNPRHAVVVHPQFTEPEFALRSAGHDVDRVVLDWPFVLDPAVVPDDADLVFVGNPTNPTSVLHPADVLRSLARPGRLLAVDEAFADCVPGEPESLAASGDVPGLIVVRSLTKMWGLAGLRVGYALADSDIITALAGAQPRWSASAPALVACVECSKPAAVAEADDWANRLATQRDHLVGLLDQIPGVETVPGARASFVLVRIDPPGVQKALRDKGFAVRRGDTFPGLGPEWIRIAVRDERTSSAFAVALKELA